MAVNMSSFTTDIPVQLNSIVSSEEIENGLLKLVGHSLQACAMIGANLRSCQYSSTTIGSVNEFGDNQLDVDVKADDLIFDTLRQSGLVAVGCSEEHPHEIPLDGEGYSVAFDPLDGSSIIDANFAVGTIMGIWPGSTLLNRTGREQVCSIVAQFGPRVTAAVAFNSSATTSGSAHTMELTLMGNAWVVSIPKISIASKATTFGPGNLRACVDNHKYKALVDYWIENQYTLRYSGGLVPDIYHMLIKGQGVMSNASSRKCKAKLRLLFECAPIALIIEGAGGHTCVCPSEAEEAVEPVSLLDVPVDHLDRRVGVCFGSSEEVARFREYLFV